VLEHRRRYGYRRVSAELRRQGMLVNHKRVARIMREDDLLAQPAPGLVHHSDRGVQYASEEYVAMLEKRGMIPSMSRPANPYHNASCESFIKTLKREEIYANEYDDLEHLLANLEQFVEQYYNRQRLHSALGYSSPEEYERQAENPNSVAKFSSATMRFFQA
jgi:putative transposase